MVQLWQISKVKEWVLWKHIHPALTPGVFYFGLALKESKIAQC